MNNDTNRCIDQYQGNFEIPQEDLNAWGGYVDALRDMAGDYGLRTAIVIAPGKEYVHSEDFPYSRGATTPVDEILGKFGHLQPIVFPVEAMVNEKDVTYSTDDTHWTDYGALLAARATCASFGDEFPATLPPFQLVMRVGDLGKKLLDPVRRPYFRADFSATGALVTFDNGVPNHGHIRRYENPGAANDGRVLLFGDSFSLSLAPWLSLCYREVLYVYTAGSVDERIVEKFRPDLLILQTNTRFLVKAPVVGLDLDQVVQFKLGKMTPDKLRKLKATVAAYRESPWRTWMLRVMATGEVPA